MRRLLVSALALCGCARLEASGTGDDLCAIAQQRGVEFRPTDCEAYNHTRVVHCRAEIDAAKLAQLRDKLVLEPLAGARAPGPAFGESRCLDQAPPGANAWVSSFPWIARSHYRYLLIVVGSDGHACVETEHGYG
jgi:hypothetical protein